MGACAQTPTQAPPMCAMTSTPPTQARTSARTNVAPAAVDAALRAVRAQVPVQINHGNLTALLFLQGIARAQFVD
jgi:hypothetical protein